MKASLASNFGECAVVASIDIAMMYHALKLGGALEDSLKNTESQDGRCRWSMD